MNSERIKLNEILKYGSILFFPLRDAFGFYIGRVPLRFGELWAAFYIIFFVFSSQKINKKEMLLVSILVANLFLTLLGLFFNYGKYDQNFAMKYTLRNLLNIVFILGFLFSSISFSADNIKGVMIYSFYVQICAFVLLYVTHHYFYMNKLLGWENILASGQIVNLLGMKVPRFMGTSSEPGYLASFLPMLLYYFIESNISHKRIYIAITGLMIVATFSTAVYIATIAILVVFFANNEIKNKLSPLSRP